MFDTCYEYRKINTRTKIEGSYEYKIHSYSFYGRSKKRYLVSVEEYEYFVFAVKFNLAERKECTDKYNALTHLFECPSVLGTITKILKELNDANPFTSFVFVGTNLPNEGKDNSKRYRIYALIVANLISLVNFNHYMNPKNSAYLLLNKHNLEEKLLSKIVNMFTLIYTDVDTSGIVLVS